MLVPYRKNQRKIAMGLLSFHEKMQEHPDLLKEIDSYEEKENYALYCYYCKEVSDNVQGIVGVRVDEAEQVLVLHDIVLNPSYRGGKIGFNMLDELQETYPEYAIIGTKATAAFLMKWHGTKK